MLISKTIIIGANSFLGKNIISKIGRAKTLKFSSTIKKDYIHYKIGDNIDDKINKKFKITKIIYLAWERRNIKKNNENINIYGTTFWTQPPFVSTYDAKMFINEI
jgi:hypothetical protein